ncbi:hypothetical protein PZA11_001366 [Diplocarpon coronariae]|uniref:Uncharacterized protein n=1 Tax=Diplocarpon coronariae TaxID=2795749 RepID=A0A218Z2N5_9HELO|nr:hypothetical protein B2J93_497 [Marssonina coronariae]
MSKHTKDFVGCQPGPVADQVLPLKAEGAITQIRTAIQRYRTSRDALVLETAGPSSTDEVDSVIPTPGMKTDAETLIEIEQVIQSLEATGLDTSGEATTQADSIPPPVNSVEEARWQSRARVPLEVQTHPTSFAPFNHHIEDLKVFKDDLIAAKKCSEVSNPAYTTVEVLLLTWEECDDIQEEIESEIEALARLFKELNYNATQFAIPNIDCQNELQWKVLEFLRQHKNDSPSETLFIVYYTGHGSIRNDSCYWHPTWWAASPSDRKDRNSRQNGPTIEWAKIQENFERTKQDVLFVLDCCYAGSAAMHKGISGTKELLAACGSDEMTPAGENSFTHRLVDCIRRMVKEEQAFQVAWLYESMIQASQNPLCLHVKLNRSPTSICLSSLAEATANNGSRSTAFEMNNGHLAPPSPLMTRSPSSATSSRAPSLFSRHDDSDDTTQISMPEPDPVAPSNWHYRVLLSVKLRANILPKAEDWCLTFPPGQVEGLEDVTFQSLYPTKSTLLFLTIPVRQWLLLRDNPAYTFIDFVEGDNFMHSHPHTVSHPEPEAASDIAPVSRTDSDKSTCTSDLNENDVVGYLLAAMHGFFEHTKSFEDKQVRRPGKIARTCQYIAENLGVPSRLESDPRFAIVQHIVQHLIIDRDDKGDFASVRYGLQLDVLVERILETGKKSIKEALHKVHDKDGDLDTTINTEFNQLERNIARLTKLENEGLAVKKLMAESPSSAKTAHTRSLSEGLKKAKTDIEVPGSDTSDHSCIGVPRKDSTKTRTGSWRSKLDSARTDPGMSLARPLSPLEYLKRKFSK